MHYCIHLFTKALPTKNEIQSILSPYNSEDLYTDEEGNEKEIKEYPPFTWDWWQIGGRYQGRLKLKVDETDTSYNWRFYAKEPREGRLFHSLLLSRIREHFPSWEANEEDYFGYLGYLEENPYIRVDGAKIADLLNATAEELGCYGFVDIDGTAYSRSRWNGEHFEENAYFDDQYRKKLHERSDSFLTVIDIHD